MIFYFNFILSLPSEHTWCMWRMVAKKSHTSNNVVLVHNKFYHFKFISLWFVFIKIILSLIGMQLYGGKFTAEALGMDESPRSNYDTFLWSFVTTFQILTGENWNEVMWNGVLVGGWFQLFYFIPCVMIGCFVVLNLFLAILIDEFSSHNERRQLQNLKEREAEETVRKYASISKWTHV